MDFFDGDDVDACARGIVIRLRWIVLHGSHYRTGRAGRRRGIAATDGLAVQGTASDVDGSVACDTRGDIAATDGAALVTAA